MDGTLVKVRSLAGAPSAPALAAQGMGSSAAAAAAILSGAHAAEGAAVTADLQAAAAGAVAESAAAALPQPQAEDSVVPNSVGQQPTSNASPGEKRKVMAAVDENANIVSAPAVSIKLEDSAVITTADGEGSAMGPGEHVSKKLKVV